MGTPLIRAMNTIDLLHAELTREREKRQAMDMCFTNISKTLLSRFKGHLINRIRHHMTLHHNVYLRRIRVMKKQDEIRANAVAKSSRRSLRVGIAEDLSQEVERLKSLVVARDEEIESLCKRIDSSDRAIEKVVGKKKRPALEDLADCESD